MLEVLVKSGTSVEIAFFFLLKLIKKACVILSNMGHKCKIWKKNMDQMFQTHYFTNLWVNMCSFKLFGVKKPFPQSSQTCFRPA